MKNPNTAIKTFAAVLALVFCLAPGVADALDVYMAALEYDKTMSDGTVVPMWGFFETDQAYYDNRGASGTVYGYPADPGPTIVAPSTGSLANRRLRIYLTNMLPVPTSIVIQGQKLPGRSATGRGPTWDFGPRGPRTDPAQRVRSFDRHAGRRNPTTGLGGRRAYLWTNFYGNLPEPGTYIYQSGTDPALQVQMGLYGAVIKDTDLAPGTAYPDIPYDEDVVVLYSEIDPALHDPPTAATPLNYKPKYFLVNGDDAGGSVLTIAPIGSRVLVRQLNAGLKNIAPTLLGEDMEWVAEDGAPYPFARMSYSQFLGAGKTMDAIWVPATEDRHPLYDRRLHLSTNGDVGGGFLAFLDSVDEGVVPIVDAGAPQTVMVYDDNILRTATNVTVTGTVTSGGTEPYTYQWDFTAFPGTTAPVLTDGDQASATFDIGAPGAYILQLVATDSLGVSSTPALTNVYTNLPPVAVASAEPTVVEVGEPIQLFGGNYCAEGDPAVSCAGDVQCTASADDYCVLMSHDPEGDAFAYEWNVSGGTLDPSLSAANPVFTPSSVGSFTAELTVTETAADLLASAPATVLLTVEAAVNDPPVANPDFYTVDKNSVLGDNQLDILFNDGDPDGTINGASIVIVTQPVNGGTVVVRDGYVEFEPRRGWRGTDYFTYTVEDDLGEVSNVASVSVNIIQ